MSLTARRALRCVRSGMKGRTYMSHTCPVCKGSGKIEAPRHDADVDEKRRAKIVMAKALRGEGYSLRQIARLVGWKSVRSAAVAVADCQS